MYYENFSDLAEKIIDITSRFNYYAELYKKYKSNEVILVKLEKYDEDTSSSEEAIIERKSKRLTAFQGLTSSSQIRRHVRKLPSSSEKIIIRSTNRPSCIRRTRIPSSSEEISSEEEIITRPTGRPTYTRSVIIPSSSEEISSEESS